MQKVDWGEGSQVLMRVNSITVKEVCVAYQHSVPRPSQWMMVRVASCPIHPSSRLGWAHWSYSLPGIPQSVDFQWASESLHLSCGPHERNTEPQRPCNWTPHRMLPLAQGVGSFWGGQATQGINFTCQGRKDLSKARSQVTGRGGKLNLRYPANRVLFSGCQRNKSVNNLPRKKRHIWQVWLTYYNSEQQYPI